MSAIEANEATCSKIPKWQNLPAEVREHTIGFMDFKTRRALLRCSPLDRRLVHSAPIQIEILTGIVASWFSEAKFLVAAEFVEKSGEEYDYHLCRHEHEKIYNTNEAFKVLKHLLRVTKYSVTELNIQNLIPTSEIYLKTIKCEKLKVTGMKKEEDVQWWMEKVSPNLQFLEVGIEHSATQQLSDDFISHHQIKNAKYVDFFNRNILTSEQFFKLNLHNFSLSVDSEFDETFRTFLMRWVNGSLDEKFYKLEMSYTKLDFRRIFELIQHREWDAEFKESTGSFTSDFKNVYRSGTFFQVPQTREPLNSATIAYKQIGLGPTYRLVFVVTGRKSVTADGFKTNYTVVKPDGPYWNC